MGGTEGRRSGGELDLLSLLLLLRLLLRSARSVWSESTARVPSVSVRCCLPVRMQWSLGRVVCCRPLLAADRSSQTRQALMLPAQRGRQAACDWREERQRDTIARHAALLCARLNHACRLAFLDRSFTSSDDVQTLQRPPPCDLMDIARCTRCCVPCVPGG